MQGRSRITMIYKIKQNWAGLVHGWCDFGRDHVPEIKDIGESFTFSKLDADFAFRAHLNYFSATQYQKVMPVINHDSRMTIWSIAIE